MFKLLSLLTVVLLGMGCATAPTGGSAHAGVLEIRPTSAGEGLGDSPLGWIYAFDRPNGAADLCAYVWPNSTWTLAAETVRGYYGDEIMTGAIENGVAVGFPIHLIDKAADLYIAGHFTAVLDGAALSGRNKDL